MDTVAVSERAKYEDIWAVPDYREAASPGLVNVDRFLSVVRPAAGSTLVDLGCGSGEAGLKLKEFGLEVWWLDITDAALSPSVSRARFIELPVWGLHWRHWDYGFCCDVMEHIPTEHVMLTLEHILRRCATTWFSIALRPDVFGQAIGQPLHLTVRDFVWWRDRIATIGNLVDARDLCGDGLYIVER
jgi:2-polyprenyl-3-methyl-5-hydroxy-6-metoxy-1,4-benzoquinol methylase